MRFFVIHVYTSVLEFNFRQLGYYRLSSYITITIHRKFWTFRYCQIKKQKTKNNRQYCDPVKPSVIKMICIQNQLFRVGHTFCNLFCGKKPRQLPTRQEWLVAETPLIKISSSLIADVFKKYKHLRRCNCKVCGGIEYKTRR